MASKPSEEDLAFGERYEQVAADLFVAQVFPGYTATKRGEKSHIDFAVVREGLAEHLLEVKTRRVSSEVFETTAVHWLKCVSATALKRALGLETYCLVVFTDRAGYFVLSDRPDGKQFIGRDDREGAGCDHALYSHGRITWVEGLKEAIEAQVTTE